MFNINQSRYSCTKTFLKLSTQDATASLIFRDVVRMHVLTTHTTQFLSLTLKYMCENNIDCKRLTRPPSTSRLRCCPLQRLKHNECILIKKRHVASALCVKIAFLSRHSPITYNCGSRYVYQLQQTVLSSWLCC